MNLKQLLKLEIGDLLGLDIGSAFVKMIQLHKTNTGYTVIGGGITSIPDQTSENKNIEIDTANAIRRCFEQTGIKTQLAVCGVSGPGVAVRNFKFPPMPTDEIEGAVHLEAAEVCPFDIRENASIDYQLITKDKNNINGILVAATNETINKKKKLAENAFFKCVAMDVEGLAILNCFDKCEKPEPGKATAILNVGNSFTTLTIMGDDSLTFVRDIPYAGKDIDLQKNTGNDLQAACQNLIVEVTETLRYYIAQEKTSVEKIFVCGGFALTKGFVDVLNNNLEATAVLWNPFIKMPCLENPQLEKMLQENGPAFSVAAGLAMQRI